MLAPKDRKRNRPGSEPTTADNFFAPSWKKGLTSQTATSPVQQQVAVNQAKSSGLPAYDVTEMLQTSPAQLSTARTDPKSPLQLQPENAPVKNRTGMPDRLKAGLEQMSGFDLSDVRVHHNSAKPAQLNAHAYAQGQNIHLAPGQDRQLPHEGWHVVQQMQGRVKPTMTLQGEAINDDVALEREADRMGAKAARSFW
ncbi:eCIS core domain-containing protein [Leptothoe spongobia]|uniref:DUF4157 domain-containing protein n=1 Tax=Leptothoe spongobia TAU-MAC 1115 TaxID=1967444 RepID=A0A947GFV1_9CYAN|nr:DUF4157 domain-containing protein [Leptothoe spongobia]MBT9314515.1 DUF4157 domain-containing protein [Leptothoe spongobia TAU-MAC 1115]